MDRSDQIEVLFGSCLFELQGILRQQSGPISPDEGYAV